MTKTIRRRRLEGRTNYKRRFALLKSGKPRLTIRVSNKYVSLQLVASDHAKDKVIAYSTSKELLSHGWPEDKSGSLKSIHASYLTGLLFGKKIKKMHKDAILDTGLKRNVKGSRIYAALNGIVDSGFNVPHDKSVFPTAERMKTNKNLFNLLEKIKEKI